MLNVKSIAGIVVSELEEAYPPCKMIHPAYAIAKDVIGFGSDLFSLLAPIVLEVSVELGKDIWAFATSESAKRFYVSCLWNVILFIASVINVIVAGYEKLQSVKAAVNVYVAADREEVELIHAEVKSTLIQKLKAVQVVMSNLKDRAFNLISQKLEFEFQALVSAWTSQWM